MQRGPTLPFQVITEYSRFTFFYLIHIIYSISTCIQVNSRNLDFKSFPRDNIIATTLSLFQAFHLKK